MTYSVISKSSFYNIAIGWIPEIRHHVPNAKFMLVGLKADLRKNKNKSIGNVSYASARSLAASLGIGRYLECSALTQVGLSNMFQTAVQIASGDQGIIDTSKQLKSRFKKKKNLFGKKHG